jgi:hypothetical protein
MRRWKIALGVLAIGVVLMILALVPAEYVIESSHTGPSESYVLKGVARGAALMTGIIAFVLGMCIAGLWTKLIGKR